MATMATMGYNGLSLRTGLNVRTLKRLVASKQIPHIRYSARVVRFDCAAIDEWIRARTVHGEREQRESDDKPVNGRGDL